MAYGSKDDTRKGRVPNFGIQAEVTTEGELGLVLIPFADDNSVEAEHY
jgi:hypothetical protein